MKRFLQSVLCLCAFTSLAPAASVESKMMTRSVPAACATPVAETNFAPTDVNAYMWFSIPDAKAGDVASSEWIDPDGAVYPDAGGDWEKLAKDGGYCFSETFAIAGRPAAGRQGLWTVKVRWNGTPLFTLSFQLGTPAQASGLTVEVSQVITTGCPAIKLIATVRDDQGKPVSGLNASNFLLKEDGQARTVTVTTTGTSGDPLYIVILIDTSGSISTADLSNEKAAAKQLIAQLGAADFVSVYQFDSTVTQKQALTTDRAKITAAIDSLSEGGSTAIFDALAAAAQELSAVQGRKAIVLMTDGDDTSSSIKMDDAIAAVLKAGAPVFPVGFGRASQDVLSLLAQKTGGYYSAGSTSADLQQILSRLGQALAAQYEISYTSANPSIDHGIALAASMGTQQSAPLQKSAPACAAAATGVILTIQNASAAPGQSIDVPVTVRSTGQAPASFQMDIAYDTNKLKFNSARKGDQMTIAGKDVSTSAPSSGKLRVVGAGLNQGTVGDGTVAFLNFTLNGGIASGSATPLACSEPKSVDPLSKPLNTTCAPGTITAQSACGCDQNGDGAVNVADVQLIINRALGTASAGCDINGDGQVNVMDVQIVVNATLGLGCNK